MDPGEVDPDTHKKKIGIQPLRKTESGSASLIKSSLDKVPAKHMHKFETPMKNMQIFCFV